jgi:hypothetical protein
MKLTTPLAATALSLTLCFARTSAGALDTAKIDALTGLKGKMNQQEGVYKVSFPRDDVKVSIDGWTMPPFMGLGTWAAFKGTNEKAMVMGDTVLFQDEVNPVMFTALDNGLSVTALHNHFFFDEPKVFFMHIGGMGKVEQLAVALRKVYDKIKEVRAALPTPRNAFGEPSLGGKNSIAAAPLIEIFGMQGEAKEGMVKFTVGRKATMDGIELGKEIGVNTWAAFAGSDANAVVDGDFAMTEDELQPVLKSLRQSGINIVAIHNHMTNENPRIVFLHYWGRGSAIELARAIKAALSLTSGNTDAAR